MTSNPRFRSDLFGKTKLAAKTSTRLTKLASRKCFFADFFTQTILTLGSTKTGLTFTIVESAEMLLDVAAARSVLAVNNAETVSRDDWVHFCEGFGSEFWFERILN